MDRDILIYVVAFSILGILTLSLGFQAASAGGYMEDQLAMNDYGLYYTFEMNPYHINVVIEDPRSPGFAVEHFLDNTLTTYWNYVNIEYPAYNGYLELTGFNSLSGRTEQGFFIHSEARDARRMSMDQFIDVSMGNYYSDGMLQGNYGVLVPSPDDYYISQTNYRGSGTVEAETYVDTSGPMAPW